MTINNPLTYVMGMIIINKDTYKMTMNLDMALSSDTTFRGLVRIQLGRAICAFKGE